VKQGAPQKILAIFVRCNIYRFAAVELRGTRRIGPGQLAMKPQVPTEMQRDGEKR
jgi:hypothetical protein